MTGIVTTKNRIIGLIPAPTPEESASLFSRLGFRVPEFRLVLPQDADYQATRNAARQDRRWSPYL